MVQVKKNNTKKNVPVTKYVPAKKERETDERRKARELQAYATLAVKKKLANLIEATRKQKKLSIYQVSKEMGLQDVTVKNIEAGEKAYTIDAFISLCRVLGIKEVRID